MALKYTMSRDGQKRASTWVEVRLLPEELEMLKKISAVYNGDPKKWRDLLSSQLANYMQMTVYDQLEEITQNDSPFLRGRTSSDS